MDPKTYQRQRRQFLKRAAAGMATGCLIGSLGAADDSAVSLSNEHLRAVNRRRRITVQHDGYNALGKDWNRWLEYRFRWLDAPDVQIDSVWWDIQPLLKGYYPTPADSLVYQWPDKHTDIVARLVDETRKRGREVFWNHRISEVDLKPPNSGGGWTQQPHPFKQSHPDWVLDTWWPHGLWNLAVDAVRVHKVDLLRHLAETYPLDGFQLDFARHVPCLPVGRQWELRHHVTRFVRMVREMTLDVARKRGQPILLAARIPRSLAGCRTDGFDVERWAQQNLIDIFNHNEDAPLPTALAADDRATKLTIRIADPIRAKASELREVTLDAVLSGALDDDRLDVHLNGTRLAMSAADPAWKDPQICPVQPAPASGGRFDRYRIDPRQKLLRLQYAVDPKCCLVGKNQIEIRRAATSRNDRPDKIQVEKLEVQVRYQE